MSKKYIFTINAASKSLCLKNLSQNKDIVFLHWLNEEVGLIEYNGKTPFYKVVYTTPLYHIRHIFEVYYCFCNDENLYQNIFKFSEKCLDKNLNFSFQIRKTLDASFDNKCIINFSGELQQKGYELCVKAPQQIISIFATKNNTYVGVGNAKTNLSNQKGGMYHFSTSRNFISRAEYKLLEAIDCFNIDLSNCKNAIDLGASPGGWSKVLASYDLKVSAIDPAALSANAVNNKKIHHYKMTAQEFLKKHLDAKFDILVNDMKMDPMESINIVNSMSESLKEDAKLVLTLKLQHSYTLQDISKALKKLSEKFEVITARQLFHNRSEITVYAKKLS